MDFIQELDKFGLQWYYIGNKLYAECYRCHQMVCVNKAILGGLHLCW